VNHGRMKYIRVMNREEQDKKRPGERILRYSHTFIARAVNGRITMNPKFPRRQRKTIRMYVPGESVQVGISEYRRNKRHTMGGLTTNTEQALAFQVA